jgi:Macrocin-O-methyltransferase (TylF)
MGLMRTKNFSGWYFFQMVTFKIWARQIAEDFNVVLHKIARRLIRKIVEIVVTDLDLVRYFNDPAGAAAFEKENLMDVPTFRDRQQLFTHVLSEVRSDEGLFLEFGVYKGNSINRLAKIKPSVTFYGFDSFVGLPEHWRPGVRRGAFSIGGELPAVRTNVKLIRGFYADTLPAFVAAHASRTISFMHVDCDLYSSTKTILAEIKALLVPGTIIVFDEYFNAPEWREEEYKAFMEFIAESKIGFKYIGYIRTGSQVAVKLL